MPIAGVRVRTPAGDAEGLSDSSGTFQLHLAGFPGPGREVDLIATRLGFVARSVHIALRQDLVRVDLELTELPFSLDRVVVTGVAGTPVRRAQPGVVATVPVDQLRETTPLATLPDALEGRVAGMDVTSSSGSSGEAQHIWLRGGTSIAASNEPLVFIDGVRADTRIVATNASGGQASSRWFDIDPADVERIEIAKGPAAAALYGADASAGVIQIFTKHGAIGRTHFSQGLELETGGITSNWRPPANFARCGANDILMTSSAMLCHGLAQGAIVSDNPLHRAGLPGAGHTGAVRWHADGGGPQFGAYASLNVEQESGLLPQNAFDRTTFRSSLRWTPTSTFTIDAGVGFMATRTDLPQDGDNPSGFLAGGLLGSPLTVGGGQDGWFGSTGDVIAGTQQSAKVYRVTPSLQLSHIVGNRFNQRLTIGLDGTNSTGVLFVPLRSDGSSQGHVNEDKTTYTTPTVDYLANLTLLDRSDGLRIGISGGAQYLETNSDRIVANGFGLVSNQARRVSDAATRIANQQVLNTRSLGYLMQSELAWRDRTYLQVGARADWNSAFGSQTAGQLFPRFGVSYVVADGARYRSPVSWLSSLRLRAAFGTSGRAPPQGVASATYSAAPYLTPTGQIVQGVVPAGPGNPHLKPERGQELELGFDLGVLQDRLGLELTYYHKVSKDLLLALPVPPSYGFSSDPLANVGAVLNRGLEATLHWQGMVNSSAGLSSYLTLSSLHNELTDLGDVAPFTNQGHFITGHPLGALYDYRVLSVDSVAGHAVVSDSAEYVGSPMPTCSASWGSTLTLLGSIHIATSLDGRWGYWQNNSMAGLRDRTIQNGERSVRSDEMSADERLRRFGPYVTESGKTIAPTSLLGPYLQNASYVRWRELSVTWDLPARWAAHFHGSQASITVAGRNLHLWTRYEGDPENISYISETGSGGSIQYWQLNFATMPQPYRWSTRVNVRF